MQEKREASLIWVLEDSALEAEMLRRTLVEIGEVELFSEGSSVLERLANGVVPDVVVLDWQLPTISGIELCRFLREREEWSKIPVLMLTMYGRKQDIVAAFEAGANDYVTKPFDVMELLARVRTLARTSRLQRQDARRARHYQLVAEIGAALTRAQDVAVMEQDTVRTILGHTRFESASIVGPASGAMLVGVEVPASVVQAAIADGCCLATRIGDRFVAVFPLGSIAQPIGALLVADPAPLDAALLEDVGTVGDMLALGVARLSAESAREVALERERLARAAAERANNSKDDFLAMVSHELRTPLTAILGWMDVLGRDNVNADRVRHGLRVIERNARAQAQLIDDLLDISRIISGKLGIDRGPVELGAIVGLVIEAVRPTAQGKGVEVQHVPTPDMLYELIGDLNRLQQVVSNLVSNAVKFTDAGGRVSVRLERRAGTVAVIVSDTGRGIDPAFLPHVFERYRQADTSTRRDKGGLGLGLAIASHLAQLHGGDISATSEGIGKGATFTLVLPDADGALSIPALSSTRTRAEPHGELAGMRIVIAEDDPDARELLAGLLARYGAKVDVAHTAEEAFDLVRASTPDLLVSDIGMPGEDGLSLIRRIRALGAADGGRVPAVALTAFAAPKDRVSALRAGFHAHVAKPVDPSELIAVVSSVLASRTA